MSYLAGRLNVIIDWNDSLLVDIDGPLGLGGNNNITEYVQRIDVDWGFGVTSSSTHFSATMLRGKIKLNRDLDHIPREQREGVHYMRFIIDNNVIVQCYAEPAQNRTMKLSSPNTALLRERIDITSVEPRTDYWLWSRVMNEINARRGNYAHFNGYDLHGGLRVKTSFAGFLLGMMSFGGGYSFEDRWCRMNFISANAGRTRNYLELVDENKNDVVRLDIAPKPGLVRNAAKARIVRVNPFVTKLIRTYTFTLPSHGYREIYTAEPEGEIASQWRVDVTSPNPAPDTLEVDKTAEDSNGVNWTAFNAGADSVDVVVEVRATTYDISANEEVLGENVPSILVYGFQPLERFPDWGSSARPMNEELDRLKDPLLICKLRMPIVPEVLPNGALSFSRNTVPWLFYDTGTLMRMSDGDRSVVMMIGRKYIYNRRALFLEWDLVEFPQGNSAYEQGWLLDNPEFELGINTVVYDPAIRTSIDANSNELSYNGRQITRGGESIQRPPFNPLMHNHKFVKREGSFISRRLAS